MHRFQRTDRVSHLLHHEIAGIIRFEVDDKRLEMVSVTAVEPARDFKTARVYVSVLGDGEALAEALKALESSAPFIRARLRERIVLKYIPMLSFYHDPSIAEGARINTLLNELNRHEP